MKVVILCGGLGTRLREETEFRPKPMVEVGGRPILWHIMKTYAHYGFHDFVLCLGYRGNTIKDYFLNYEAMNNDFSICLGRKSEIRYHGSHDEQGFSVTLADTGIDCMTGGRIHRIRALHRRRHLPAHLWRRRERCRHPPPGGVSHEPRQNRHRHLRAAGFPLRHARLGPRRPASASSPKSPAPTAG